MRSTRETTRRMVCAALAVMLVLCFSFAGAESSGVYRIYVTDAEGEEPTGVAIPLAPGVALTSVANMPEPVTSLTLADEEENRDVLEYETMGVMAFLYYDGEEDETDMVWQPWLDFEMPVSDQLTVLTVDNKGNRVAEDVISLTQMNWNGVSSGVVTLSGPVELGAPLLTDEGCLAGMIVAEYAEGKDRYVFMTFLGIYLEMLKVADPEEETEIVPEAENTETDGGFVSAPIP